MYNGTKLVFFGGFSDFAQTIPLNDIYILDTTTMAWTSGKPAGGSFSRARMACGASGKNIHY